MVHPLEIHYSNARRIFWGILSRRVAERGEVWIPDEYNRVIIPNLIRYALGDPAFNQAGPHFDLRKGITLFGAPGRGKSLLLASLNELLAVCSKIQKGKNSWRAGRQISTTAITDRLLKTLDKRTVHDYYQGTWFFDDVGVEPVEVNAYGKVKPFVDIVNRMHDLWEKYDDNKRSTQQDALLYMTTNLDPTDTLFDEHFDERIGRRIRQMTNVIWLGGAPKGGALKSTAE